MFETNFCWCCYQLLFLWGKMIATCCFIQQIKVFSAFKVFLALRSPSVNLKTNSVIAGRNAHPCRRMTGVHGRVGQNSFSQSTHTHTRTRTHTGQRSSTQGGNRSTKTNKRFSTASAFRCEK